MATLVANNGETPVSRIELQAGINTVGRAGGNHHVVAHSSVSSRHCEIVVGDSAITIRDLGSTNGTFVDDKPVQEANVTHGQRLKLGSTEFVVEAPEVPAVLKTGALRVNVAKSASVAEEVPPPIATGRTAAEAIAALTPTTHEEPSFYSRIPGAFVYPFKKSGIILLILATVLFTVLDFLSSASSPSISGRVRVTRFSLLITVISLGYLFAYMQKVIAHSAQGEDEMPDFPDITEWWSDILQPFLFFAGTLLVSLLPAIAILVSMGQNEMVGLGLFPALAFGAFYLPMALLAVAVTDNFLGLSPHVVVPSILRTFVPYCVTFVLLVVLVTVRVAGGLAVREVPVEQVPLKILATVVMEFFSLYLLMVEMRILGLLFRSYRSRLGWI